jgi:hypothetical protein
MAPALASALAGCSSGGGGGSANASETTGSMEVALSTTGPDGATYSLPPTTTLLMSSPVIIADPYLNATTPTQSFSLPAGNYQVTLQGGTDAGAFVLNRTAGGVTSTMTAFLVDPQPRTVTLTAGRTTPVVFHFLIPEIGNVTFSNGTLVSSIQVDAGGASASHAVVTGPLVFQNVFPGMDPSVAALFSSWDTPTEQISITMSFTTGWTAALDSACVDGTATVTATPSVNSANDQNVAAFLSEFNGAGFSLCLADANNGGGVNLIFERTGTPESPQFQMAVGATDEMNYYFQLNGTPPTPLFDGVTANLAALSQPLSLPMTMFGNVNVASTYPVQFSNTMGSTLSLQLTP